MITTRLSGGMGNQMFQYAAGRALSEKHNVPLKLDTTFLDHRIKMPKLLRPSFSFRSFDLDVFNIVAEMAKPEEITFWNRPILWGRLMLAIDAVLRKLALFSGWEKRFSFNKEFLSFGPNSYLQGFWQSEKYFLDIADTIRQDFALREALPELSRNLADEIKSKNSLCIHFRRMHGGGSFHSKYDMDYYNRSLAYIKQKGTPDKIYVFSDDVDWCRANIKFDLPTFFVSREYAGKKGERDMYLMSKCKYFIIPNSTFSWWGAWLSARSGKIVIAPKDWFADASIDTSDLIPKDWIRI
jgi:hypothetical protein